MNIATCIGCGCTDTHACPGVPCHWLAVDYTAGVGFCSACPDYLDAFTAGEHTMQIPSEAPSNHLVEFFAHAKNHFEIEP